MGMLVIRKNVYQIALVFYLASLPFTLLAKEDKDFILKLDGVWKFSIGDNKEWANPEFDDTSWENIKVPSAWEDQGFYGWDGFAWYRTSFGYSKEMKGRDLFINLGYINDVDKVYINGHLVGFSGSFPPNFSTALQVRRKYPIPEEFLNQSGKNVICVRVYNHQMEGGILSGDIGISYSNIKTDYSLAGLWLFRTGDNKIWKEAGYKDKLWKSIVVPNNWESQGYSNYDGYAWYRKHFLLPEELNNQKIVLVIGKVFHIEEVYLNGVLIGSSGKMPTGKVDNPYIDDVKIKYSAYPIPENLLLINKANVVAGRVFNIQHKGGIVEGPVGIFKLGNFNKYFKDLIGNEE